MNPNSLKLTIASLLIATLSFAINSAWSLTQVDNRSEALGILEKINQFDFLSSNYQFSYQDVNLDGQTDFNLKIQLDPSALNQASLFPPFDSNLLFGNRMVPGIPVASLDMLVNMIGASVGELFTFQYVMCSVPHIQGAYKIYLVDANSVLQGACAVGGLRPIPMGSIPWNPLETKVYIGDSNGDGRKDLFVTFLEAWKGKPAGGLVINVVPEHKIPLQIMSVIPENLFSRPLSYLHNMKLADINGDGRDDIVALVGRTDRPIYEYALADKLGHYLRSTKDIDSPMEDNPPSESAQCHYKVNEPESSSGFYFSESCSELYVLPPAIGLARVTNVETVNLAGQCQRVNQHIEQDNHFTQRISELSDELVNMAVAKLNDSEYERMKSDIDEINKVINRLVTKKESLQADAELQDQLMLLQQEQLLFCFDDCSDEQFRINSIQKQKEFLQRMIDQYSYQIVSFSTLIEDLEENLKNYTDGLLQQESDIQSQISDIMRLQDERKIAYRDLISREGGILSAEFDLLLIEHVREFREINPHIHIPILPMPIVSTDLISETPSATKNGVDQMLWSVVNDDAQPQAIRQETEINQHLYQDAFWGQFPQRRYQTRIGMSLGGLCPYLTEGGKLTLDSLDKVALSLSPTMKYEYQVKQDIPVRYMVNIGELAKLLSQVVSRNQSLFAKNISSLSKGLILNNARFHQFHTRNNTIIDGSELERMIVNLDEERWFSVRFGGTSDTLTLQQQEEIRQELKLNAIKLVISEFTNEFSYRGNHCLFKFVKECHDREYVVMDFRALENLIRAHRQWKVITDLGTQFKTRTVYQSFKTPEEFF